MDEQPREPLHRRETVERREIVEGEPTASLESRRKGGGGWWIWLIALALVVGGLAWYVLSRGEPQTPELPEFEAPAVELPAPEQRVEIEVPEPEAAPAEGANQP